MTKLRVVGSNPASRGSFREENLIDFSGRYTCTPSKKNSPILRATSSYELICQNKLSVKNDFDKKQFDKTLEVYQIDFMVFFTLLPKCLPETPKIT